MCRNFSRMMLVVVIILLMEIVHTFVRLQVYQPGDCKTSLQKERVRVNPFSSDIYRIAVGREGVEAAS